MVVVGLGEGQGEVMGEGWWVLWESPSTTSPPFSASTFRGDNEPLCSVFSGLERVKEDEEEEDEEVVEEDSVQAGSLMGGSSLASET